MPEALDETVKRLSGGRLSVGKDPFKRRTDKLGTKGDIGGKGSIDYGSPAYLEAKRLVEEANVRRKKTKDRLSHKTDNIDDEGTDAQGVKNRSESRRHRD